MPHSVLFVDDEQGVCSALKRTFRKSPYIIYEANSGEQALSLLKAHDVDVVISDQRMPGMNGTELLTIIKNQYPSVGRVMLSGYSDFDALTDAVNEANIFRFLPKPWDEEALFKTIDEAIHDSKVSPNNIIPFKIEQPSGQDLNPLAHIYTTNHITAAANDITESFFKKQIELEQDIKNDELTIIESSIVDRESPDNTLHYLSINWPRYQSFGHEHIIDMAKQADYLEQLYTWYALKISDLCHQKEQTTIQPGKKIVVDIFCEQMIANKSLRSILLSLMRQHCQLIFRIPFSMLSSESLEHLLKATYISSASLMLSIGKRIFDVKELEYSGVGYLEMDARYNTINNSAITQKRIKMLEDAQNLTIKTILTEVTGPEQFLYAKKMNVDFLVANCIRI